MHEGTYPLSPGVDLPVYQALYNTKCCICKKVFAQGEWIARLPEDVHALLREMKIVGLQKRYAHIDCLPEPMVEPHLGSIKRIASQMLQVTDPTWPKDFTGFNKPDAYIASRWFNTNSSPYGALYVALALRKYTNTQLGEEIYDLILNAVVDTKKRQVAKQRLWKVERESKGNSKSSSSNDTNSSTKTQEEKPEVHVTKLVKNPVKIDALDQVHVKVYLDPPWQNQEHGQIKDFVKVVSAGFERDKPPYWKAIIEKLIENWDQCFPSNIEVELTQAAKDVILHRLKKWREKQLTPEQIEERLSKVLAPGLKLRPFQLEGVAFAQQKDGRCIIAHQMGLGKTIQAIGYLGINPESRPGLVVCPSIVAKKWELEIKKWLPKERVYRVTSGDTVVPRTVTMVVTTFDLLRRIPKQLGKFEFKVAVVDESHYLKNYKTARTKSFLSLCEDQKVEQVLCLSGTPIVNRPAEFFTTLHLLRPNDYKSWTWFAKRYCGGKKTDHGWEATGATNTEELATRLKTLMVRRLKKDVLSELPEKIRTTIPIELTVSERNQYENLIEQAYEGKSSDHLRAIGVARQYVGKVKAEAALAVIEDYLLQEEPLVVFAHHQDVIDLICAKCKQSGYRYGRIDGSVSQSDRGDIAKSFQDGELDVVILGIKSGGVGIDLYRASNVLMVERAWTPGDEEQAEDRTHRIGQLQQVTVKYLMVENSVDEMMDGLIEKKRKILEAVLDGGTPLTKESQDIRQDLVELWIERFDK